MIRGLFQGFGPNPEDGYTGFDDFGLSYVSAYRMLTRDSWENLFRMVIRSSGTAHLFYFAACIFFCGMFLLNMILAIVAMSYDELQRQAEEEA